MNMSSLYVGSGVFTLCIILIAIAGIKLSRKLDRLRTKMENELQALTECRLTLVRMKELLLTGEQMEEVNAYVRAFGEEADRKEDG